MAKFIQRIERIKRSEGETTLHRVDAADFMNDPVARAAAHLANELDREGIDFKFFDLNLSNGDLYTVSRSFVSGAA